MLVKEIIALVLQVKILVRLHVVIYYLLLAKKYTSNRNEPSSYA